MIVRTLSSAASLWALDSSLSGAAFNHLHRSLPIWKRLHKLPSHAFIIHFLTIMKHAEYVVSKIPHAQFLIDEGETIASTSPTEKCFAAYTVRAFISRATGSDVRAQSVRPSLSRGVYLSKTNLRASLSSSTSLTSTTRP